MEYLNKILDNSKNVVGEIYIMRNLVNDKCYVGQTVTHRKNHGKYRPFGYIGRFKDHISEALCNTKKKQCSLLNNAIRKHGEDNFTVELVLRCDLVDLDDMEKQMISHYDTMYPNGYNLTGGGKVAPPQKSHNIDNNTSCNKRSSSRKSMETKSLISQRLREHIHENPQAIQRLSSTAKEQHFKDKLTRFKSVCEFLNKEDPYSHITFKSNRYIVTIKDVKTSFIGKYSTRDDLYKDAVNLLDTLLSFAT